MIRLFYKKKFQIGQLKQIDQTREFSLLETILEIAVEDEDYEFAAIIYSRMKTIKSNAGLDRS